MTSRSPATRIDHDSLADALAAFQAVMPTVGKTKTARIPGRDGKSGYTYEYADLADVTAAAMPLLTQHGLSFTAAPRITDRGGYELVGILRHATDTPDSPQRDEGALPLHGNTPQQLGGAITYARRYLLGCMTGIVTDDDTDAANVGDDRTQPADPPPPPYNGPSTEAMLTELDQLARDHDLQYADMMKQFTDHRGITLDDLDRHPAADLHPYYLHVIASHRAKP